MKKIVTLCMVHKDDKLLLGMKKRGFGVGRWNGFGGKVEESETIEDGALRELREEAGIEAQSIEKFGILEFSFENEPKILEAHIFKVIDFTGEPLEGEEMRPEWFGVEAIPYDKMWSDDIYWLPALLTGKKFKGKFLFDRPSDAEYSAKILNQEIIEVEEI